MKNGFLFFCFMLSAIATVAQVNNTTYAGTLKGYNPAWGFKTGRIIIDNEVTGLSNIYLINIDSNGKFSAVFPLENNKECWVSFPFFNGAVYFEAGKTTTQHFDLTAAPDVSSIFEGDGVIINNDLNKVRPITAGYDWDNIDTDIYQLTPTAYKDYFLRMQARKLSMLDSVARTDGLHKIAYRLASDDISYSIADLLISYNSTMETTYRKKNGISFENRSPVLKETTLEEGYFDFLPKLRYNDPSVITSYNHHIFINHLKSLRLIYDRADRIDYTAMINRYKQLDTTDSDVRTTLAQLQAAMNKQTIIPGSLEKARPVVLKELLHTNITLELEIMELQDICQQINGEKSPLPDTAMTRLESRLVNRWLFPSVLALNNAVRREAKENATKTNYAYNETPKGEPDGASVLNEIIHQYEGKVLLIDFWATWCAPCLQQIEEYAPMKTALKDQDIKFLYITNNTSPEKAYHIIIPAIPGEHYRVTADQYNSLSAHFNISGIPHYMIVNKAGIIVSNGPEHPGMEQMKEKLLSLARE